MKSIIMASLFILGLSASVSHARAPGSILASGDYGTVWQCLATYKIMRDSTVPDQRTPEISISAAGNEYEPFQIVITPKRSLKSVKVTPHALKGPDGAKIDAWNISIRNVGYLTIKETTTCDRPPGDYPDPLPEFEPFLAPAGKNSPVWITVYVPTATIPGDYDGTIDIEADNLKKIAIPLKLHVRDFRLPTVSKLRTAYGCYVEPPVGLQGAKTLEQKRRISELYNLDCWRHRISPYRPWTYYGVKTKLENGKLSLDFSNFDIAVSKFFHLFNSYMLPGFGVDEDLPFKDSDNYEQMKIEYMRMVAEHLAEKGQLDKGYNYIFDEPGQKHYPGLVKAADLCRKADRRIKVLLTEQVEDDLVGSVDIWVPIMYKYDEAKSKARQAAGEEVWWYVCCKPYHPYPNNFIDYPAIDHRVLHWLTWRYGVTGVLYWEVTYWGVDPYKNAMSTSPSGKRWGNGDGRLLYPAVKKASDTFVEKGPVPSIRWEMIREGIEDYDYFVILRDKLEATRKTDPFSPGIAVAEQALKDVDAAACSCTQFTSQPFKLMTIRAQIAEAIEAL